MSARHRRTLAAIFERPTRASIAYDDVIAMLRAAGAEVDEGREGSRVMVFLNGVVFRFHRPHPGKELKKYQVEDLRVFLTNAGLVP